MDRRKLLNSLKTTALTVLGVIVCGSFTLFLLSNLFGDISFVKNLFTSSEKPVEQTLAVEQPQPVLEQKPTVEPVFTAENIVTLVNEYRTENGKKALVVIPELQASAKEKCEDIITSGVFEHYNPNTGINGIEIAHKHYGKTTYYSENLGRTALKESNVFVKNWKISPPHNAGMLADVTYTGVAVCTSGVQYAVQHFAN
jgi:uncharacterized protein YkwD